MDTTAKTDDSIYKLKSNKKYWQKAEKRKKENEKERERREKESEQKMKERTKKRRKNVTNKLFCSKAYRPIQQERKSHKF